MCRWQTYCGPAIYMDQLIYEPEHSLIDQSMHALESKSAINADGVGVGWYGERNDPGVYRQIQPAWNDNNLRNLAHHISASLFFAHVRTSTGTAVSISNCHPFVHDNCMFMHNGKISNFAHIRRDMEASIPDDAYEHRLGTTDSEAFFLMMFANGLDSDPAAAFRDTIAQVETMQEAHGFERQISMAAVVTDGEQITAVRYSSTEVPPSLYWDGSGNHLTLVSEPFTEDHGRWTEVPADQVLHASREGIGAIEALH
jgi:predicted glutamine amidotransferase